MPLSTEEKQTRRAQAAQMRLAASKRQLRPSDLCTLLSGTSKDAFNILQGMDLENPLFDVYFRYLCPEEAASLVQAAPEPPKPARLPQRIDTPESINPLSGQQPNGQLVAMPAVAKPDPVPPVEILPRDDFSAGAALVVDGIATLVAPTEEVNSRTPANLEVGRRLRTAMEAAGHTPKSLGLVLGHQNGNNVCSALGKGGSRKLQLRLSEALGLDAQGHPVPGKSPAPVPEQFRADKVSTPPKPAKPLATKPDPGPGRNASTVKPPPEIKHVPPPTPEPVVSIDPAPVAKHARSNKAAAIGAKVRAAIEKAGYTVQQVAWHLGHERASNVSAALNGCHAPQLLGQLCTLLGLDPHGEPDASANLGHRMPPAAEIHSPVFKIGGGTIQEADRLADAAKAIQQLAEAAAYWKESREKTAKAEEVYHLRLAAVRRLGLHAR